MTVSRSSPKGDAVCVCASTYIANDAVAQYRARERNDYTMGEYSERAYGPCGCCAEAITYVHRVLTLDIMSTLLTNLWEIWKMDRGIGASIIITSRVRHSCWWVGVHWMRERVSTLPSFHIFAASSDFCTICKASFHGPVPRQLNVLICHPGSTSSLKILI